MRRPLHWVLKIGNLKSNYAFFHRLGMDVQRHEEFQSGCEATCNGPYGGAWSKTMVGYGDERTHTALELTYNYGIESYTNGNDLRYIALGTKDLPLKTNAEDNTIMSPDGYKFLLVPEASGNTPSDPFLFVSINVSDLEASRRFYMEILGMTERKGVPGALNKTNTVMLGYGDESFSLELVEAGRSIDHAESNGRLAIGTEAGAHEATATKIREQEVGSVVHGPLTLAPHDEKLVIVSDPDGYEVCVIEEETFQTQAGKQEIDWTGRKARGGDGHPLVLPSFAPSLGSLTAVETQEEIKQAIGSKKLVVVDFMASWCRACKRFAPKVESLASEHDDVVFLKCDIGEAEDLAKTYDVSSIPRFLLFKDTESAVADILGPDEETLRSLIQQHK